MGGFLAANVIGKAGCRSGGEELPFMKSHKFQSITFIISVLSLMASPAIAQREGVEIVQTLRGNPSAPLREVPPEPPRGGPLRVIPNREIPSEKPQSGGSDGALQTTVGPAVATTPGFNFDGVGQGFVGPNGGFSVNVAPPDTNGAVGATQYVQWVNLSFAIFDKATGNVLYGPTAGKTLWAGMPLPGGPPGSHPCAQNNDGDIIAQYDKAANRWVMSQLSYTNGPPYYLCIAVSHDSDASGAYTRYALEFDSLFPDYPKLAVWPDGYYLSFNMFAPPAFFFYGAEVWSLDRGAMLAGLDANAVGFQLSGSYGGLLPSDLDGSTAPPSGSPNFFLNFGSNKLNLWKFKSNFSVNPPTATLTGPTSIPVAAFTSLCSSSCVPQPGTSQKLDGLGDRLMYRLAYRNFGDHESLVVNHSVVVGSGSGVRWYEIRNPNGTPAVFQQGTYAPDSNYRWMGSAAMDQSGDIAVGYSVSGASTPPSIRYTGRVPGDPLGTLQAETSIMAGTGSQLSNLNRWGDYSGMSIDPVDDCTFWYTTEYLKSSGTFNWSTRIANFKFPSCGGATDVPPTASFTYSCTSLTCQFDGSGSSDPDGTVTSWAWDFGDGSIGSGATTSHSFATGGTYKVTLTVTDNGGATGSQSQNVTVTSGSTATTMHVAALTGAASSQNRIKWKATVTITIVDNNNSPVSSATVNGNWSGAASGSASCTTGGNGQCSVSKTNISNGGGSITFTVSSATDATLTYAPAYNAVSNVTIAQP
jgi:PKD repeat protein